VSARLARIGKADILVGIPSFNNERTIGHVVRAVVAGLARHYPDAKAVLVNSDGGSTDRTREIVERIEVGSLAEILVDAIPPSLAERIVTPYVGLTGKGSAFRTIFRIAEELDVGACCVVDSDLRSITPEWIDLSSHPSSSTARLRVPFYARHRYDGTITHHRLPAHARFYGKMMPAHRRGLRLPAISPHAFWSTTAGRARSRGSASTSSCRRPRSPRGARWRRRFWARSSTTRKIPAATSSP
jgi:hypothetical protein